MGDFILRGSGSSRGGHKMKKLISLVVGTILSASVALGGDLSTRVNSVLITDNVARNGAVVGDGVVNQNTIAIGNNRITGFLWSAYNPSDNKEEERDYGITINSDEKDLLKGKVSANISYQRWIFPEFEEDVIELQAKYSGVVNAQATLSNTVTDKDRLGEHMVHASLDKCFEVGKVGIRPSVSSAYLNGYFGESGLAHITPGLSLETDIVGFKIGLYGKYQIGDKMVSKAYAGLTLSKEL